MKSLKVYNVSPLTKFEIFQRDDGQIRQELTNSFSNREYKVTLLEEEFSVIFNHLKYGCFASMQYSSKHQPIDIWIILFNNYGNHLSFDFPSEYSPYVNIRVTPHSSHPYYGRVTYECFLTKQELEKLFCIENNFKMENLCNNFIKSTLN